MLRSNTVPREVLQERLRRAAYLKKCRQTYLISAAELMAQTKIHDQAIYRMEKGTSPWMVDTEIRYMLGIIVIAKSKKYYDIHARKTPECSIESMRKFLNIQ